MGSIADYDNDYTMQFTSETYHFTLYIHDLGEKIGRKWCARFHHAICEDGYQREWIEGLHRYVVLVCSDILEVGWKCNKSGDLVGNDVTHDLAVKLVCEFARRYKYAAGGTRTRSRKALLEDGWVLPVNYGKLLNGKPRMAC
jgi:hypothetical protein